MAEILLPSMEELDSNRALQVIVPYQSNISLKSGPRETENGRIPKIPGNPFQLCHACPTLIKAESTALRFLLLSNIDYSATRLLI